jgi:hypothetical protein
MIGMLFPEAGQITTRSAARGVLAQPLVGLIKTVSEMRAVPPPLIGRLHGTIGATSRLSGFVIPPAPLVPVTAVPTRQVPFPVYEVPARAGSPSFEVVSLGGIRYQLAFSWCEPLGVWIIDIADRQGSPIVSGMPMVTGSDILAQYRHLNFGGMLISESDFDWRVPPTFTNLGPGRLGHLYWIPYPPPPPPPKELPVSPPDKRNPPSIFIPPPTVTQPPPTCVDQYTFFTQSGFFTIPNSWNSSDNTIGAIGGGGAGAAGDATPGIGGGGGGAGGNYSQSRNIPLQPGDILQIVVGAGGVGEPAPGVGAGAGTVSRVVSMAAGSIVRAEGGLPAVRNTGGQPGPAGIGQLQYIGGGGGTTTFQYAGSGGGGAAGPLGNGAPGGQPAAPFQSASNAVFGGSGGGGNGGGRAGQNAPADGSGNGGQGGAAQDGTPGGQAVIPISQPGNRGSGGGGGVGAPSPSLAGDGGNGVDIDAGHGSGGGGGGGAVQDLFPFYTASGGGNGGNYGGGGAGGSQAPRAPSAGQQSPGGNGGAGLVFIRNCVAAPGTG